MGKSVNLDKSGWSAEALARSEQSTQYQAAIKARAAARKNHVLHDTLDNVADQSLYESGKARFTFIARDFGNGHRECSVSRYIPDLARDLERAIDRDMGVRVPRGEGDREANIRRAVREAKKRVRLKCKTLAVNSLWTLTYRANQTDRNLALKHLDEFRRRVAKVLPGWRYIACLEQQKRGSWHIHLATCALPLYLRQDGVKVKSWDVMRKLWRRCAGDLGGNFDEAKRQPRWGGKAKAFKGSGAIASYIAGYVAKDMEDGELNRKRYSSSTGIEVPAAYRAMFAAETPMAELLELAYAAVGDRITRAWWDAEREVFFIESDDSGQKRSGPL